MKPIVLSLIFLFGLSAHAEVHVTTANVTPSDHCAGHLLAARANGQTNTKALMAHLLAAQANLDLDREQLLKTLPGLINARAAAFETRASKIALRQVLVGDDEIRAYVDDFETEARRLAAERESADQPFVYRSRPGVRLAQLMFSLTGTSIWFAGSAYFAATDAPIASVLAAAVTAYAVVDDLSPVLHAIYADVMNARLVKGLPVPRPRPVKAGELERQVRNFTYNLRRVLAEPPLRENRVLHARYAFELPVSLSTRPLFGRKAVTVDEIITASRRSEDFRRPFDAVTNVVDHVYYFDKATGQPVLVTLIYEARIPADWGW